MPTYRKPAEAIVVSIPAPVGGWNARDGIANMDPADAVLMENWFPGTTSVQMRWGYTSYSSSISGQVESLMIWNGPSSSKMFSASASGNIYDSSSTGAVGAASVTSLSNGRFQYINVATTAGSYLIGVNGADKAVIYDGSWHRDGDGAPYDVSGVNTANCINVNLHKNRIWYIQKNTLDAWYMPVSAIGGTATKFSLAGVAMVGGYLVAMATWTMDAGYGMDDMAAFITSEGEVIVYSGTDPASASTWQLVGVYRIGSPIGYRCWLKYAGDLLLITQDGVQPMSGAMQSSRTNPRVSLSDKIQRAVSDAVTIYGGNFGWELCYFAQNNQLYLNVPIQSYFNQQQYVMNTITRNWCNFTGWQFNTFAIFNDELYAGGNGFVAKAWDSQQDNGTDINGTCLQAFNYFGSRGQQKEFTAIRPTFQTNGSPDIFGNINVNYDVSDASASLQSISPPGGAFWDTAIWDTDLWNPALTATYAWQGANGVGYCGAPRIKATVSAGEFLSWASTDVVFRKGAIL